MRPRTPGKPLAAAAACALTWTLGVPLAARAESKEVCVKASMSAQTLRDQRKLLETREQLRICAAAGCHPIIQHDCARWLDEVEKDLPSVIVTAKDGTGADRADVTLTIDGKQVATSLDGAPIDLNPGPHTLRVEAAGATPAELSVLLVEGTKRRLVNAVLRKLEAAASPAAPSTPTAPAPSPPPPPAAPNEPADPGPSRPPGPRFQIDDRGRIHDGQTGRTWQSSVVRGVLDAAADSCRRLGAGWRLPSAQELLGVSRLSESDQALFSGANAFVWSASREDEGFRYFLVRTSDASVNKSFADFQQAARCVR